jgi:hypothetical protein
VGDSWKPDVRKAPLAQALQRHGETLFSESVTTSGTPLCATFG